MSTGRLRAELGEILEGDTRVRIHLFQKSNYRDTVCVSCTFGEQLCDQINAVHDERTDRPPGIVAQVFGKNPVRDTTPEPQTTGGE